MVLNKFSKNTKEIKECKYFNTPKGCNNIKCQFRHIKNDILIKNDTPIIKYKTKMCTIQNCKYGSKCIYAHSREELAEDTESKIVHDITKNSLYKTRMCENGSNCKYGDKCMFAHTEEELRVTHHNEPKIVHDITKNPLYKTSMCKNGFKCTYGEKCMFAHTKEDLRVIQHNDNESKIVNDITKNPLYKTRMCENGSKCTYGERCMFAHTPEELRTTQTKKICKYFNTSRGCTKTDCEFEHIKNENASEEEKNDLINKEIDILYNNILEKCTYIKQKTFKNPEITLFRPAVMKSENVIISWRYALYGTNIETSLYDINDKETYIDILKEIKSNCTFYELQLKIYEETNCILRDITNVDEHMATPKYKGGITLSIAHIQKEKLMIICYDLNDYGIEFIGQKLREKLSGIEEDVTNDEEPESELEIKDE